MRFKSLLAVFCLALFYGISVYAYETGSAYQIMRIPSGGGRPQLGSVDISQSAAVGTTTLRPVNGGMGQDFSASTGVPVVSSGTFSVSSQLAAAKGGTGQDFSATTGVVSISSGTFSAAAQLAASKGGTGQDFSSSTGVVAVSGGTFSMRVMAGVVFPFAGTTCPTGSVAGDGSSLLRAGIYANLFTAIGTTYGSADGTHFTVPDYRGVFIRGVGTNGTATESNGGAFAGAALGTFQNDQFQGHKQNADSASTTGGFVGWFTGNNNGGTADPAGASLTSDGTNGTPRSGAETRPVNLSATYCIWF